MRSWQPSMPPNLSINALHTRLKAALVAGSGNSTSGSTSHLDVDPGLFCAMRLVLALSVAILLGTSMRDFARFDPLCGNIP